MSKETTATEEVKIQKDQEVRDFWDKVTALADKEGYTIFSVMRYSEEGIRPMIQIAKKEEGRKTKVEDSK